MSSTMSYSPTVAIDALRSAMLHGRPTLTANGNARADRPEDTVIRYATGPNRYRDFGGTGSDAVHYRYWWNDPSYGMHPAMASVPNRTYHYNTLPDTIETRYARWYVTYIDGSVVFDVRTMDADLVGILCMLDDIRNATGGIDEATFCALCDYLEERDIL